MDKFSKCTVKKTILSHFGARKLEWKWRTKREGVCVCVHTWASAEKQRKHKGSIHWPPAPRSSESQGLSEPLLFLFFRTGGKKTPSQMQIPNLSANVGEGLRLQGLLLCALSPLRRREGAQKKRKTPVASDSELWVFYPDPYMFETFSGQPNNFNNQNFIDIIANNGRCFPAGNNGPVPLIIVIINRKSSGCKRAHAQKCSPGFGSRSSWWVTVFHFLPLLYFALVIRDTFLNTPRAPKK